MPSVVAAVAERIVVGCSVAGSCLLAMLVILGLFTMILFIVTLPSRNNRPGSFFIIVMRYPGFRYRMLPVSYSYFKYGNSVNFSISKNSVILFEFAKRC